MECQWHSSKVGLVGVPGDEWIEVCSMKQYRFHKSVILK